jgi:hypothetical protein
VILLLVHGRCAGRLGNLSLNYGLGPPIAHVAPATSEGARLRAYGPYVVVVAALGFMLWCTLTTLSRPGLHYDESLFVNAALDGPYAGGGFVVARFHGVPTMVMPYSGALKSWLYAPLFAVFDGSAALVRLPMTRCWSPRSVSHSRSVAGCWAHGRRRCSPC